MAEAKKVRVTSHMSHPINLALYEMKDVGLGLKEARRTGEQVTLRPGINEDVDEAFLTSWREQNGISPILDALTIEKDGESKEG